MSKRILTIICEVAEAPNSPSWLWESLAEKKELNNITITGMADGNMFETIEKLESELAALDKEAGE